MPDPIITIAFDGQPGISLVQGEDRTITLSFENSLTGSPLDLTGATVMVAFDAFAGGTVRRSSGAITVPASAITSGSAFTVVNHGLVTGDPVIFSGSPPSPLVAGTTYLVQALDVNTFTLTTTGGSAVSVTAAATGSYGMTCADITIVSPATSGLATLSLRAAVTAALQDGQAQSFQVQLVQSGKVRITLENNELDVFAQVSP